jgi:subtilisin-like proprotein convertase family protein
VDGDTLTVLSVGTPTSGTLTWSVAEGRWTYTPNTGFHGTDSFTYTLSDGELTATGTVTITVRQTAGTTIYAATSKGTIKDAGTSTFTMNVTDTRNILDLNVTLNLSHPALAELKVFLRGPDGTRIELASALKGTSMVGTVLDDEAGTSILNGTAPYTGSFRPTGALSAFDGKQLNGTWTLEIVDNKKRNVGTLNSWSLTVQWGSAMTAASLAPAVTEVSPAPTLEQVTTLADAALERWYSDGSFSTELLARIDSIRFEIVDLPGQMLAFTTWDVIYIDSSAAGFGWFIDVTPNDSQAFNPSPEEGALLASKTSSAYGRMDLLTVLGHELGNLLGLEDKPAGSADLMSATLEAGTRLDLDAGAASAATAAALDQQMVMARAAVAWASAQAHDSAFMPAFSALWMPGVFFGKSFGGEKSLRSDDGWYSALATVAMRGNSLPADAAVVRFSLHETRGGSTSGLLERFLD